MSDTYSYEVLEPGGHARLVGNVLDRISRASANPASAVGSSRAVLGDPETASWMERTTAADGAALIEAVYGNPVTVLTVEVSTRVVAAVNNFYSLASLQGAIGHYRAEEPCTNDKIVVVSAILLALHSLGMKLGIQGALKGG